MASASKGKRKRGAARSDAEVLAAVAAPTKIGEIAAAAVVAGDRIRRNRTNRKKKKNPDPKANAKRKRQRLAHAVTLTAMITAAARGSAAGAVSAAVAAFEDAAGAKLPTPPASSGSEEDSGSSSSGESNGDATPSASDSDDSNDSNGARTQLLTPFRRGQVSTPYVCDQSLDQLFANCLLCRCFQGAEKTHSVVCPKLHGMATTSSRPPRHVS